jgi:hypothetical protein
VTGFVRLPLQRNVQQGLKKSADIEGEPVFWGSGLEKFIYIYIYHMFTPLSRGYHSLHKF